MRIVFCLLSAFFVTILPANTGWTAEELKLDAKNSKISFVGSKPDGSSHEGGFKEFAVDVKADLEQPANSQINIEIKTDSLWSDNPKLTGHLKNPDFFDVRKYPKAVFKSTSIESTGEGKATIKGQLQLLGKTEEVEIPVTIEATDSMVKLNGKFKLDRYKWGMDYGGDRINKNVDMTVQLVLLR